MKKHKFTLLEYIFAVWVILIIVCTTMAILSDEPPKSLIQQVGETAREIKDEFDKGYKKEN